jgi:hypothetical protein
MILVTKNILLKNYILHLIDLLLISIKIDEISYAEFVEIKDIFINFFIIERHSFKFFKSKLKKFVSFFRKLKTFLISKRDIILFNKIYKILLNLKKLLLLNDVEKLLNSSLKDIEKEGLFLYLPYSIELKIIFKNV